MAIKNSDAFLDEIIYIYLAHGLHSGQVRWDEDEELGVEKWKLEDLLEMIRNGKMTDSKTVSAIMTYAAGGK